MDFLPVDCKDNFYIRSSFSILIISASVLFSTKFMMFSIVESSWDELAHTPVMPITILWWISISAISDTDMLNLFFNF